MARFRIVSGGQTGADQAGLRAARSLGIPTGGYAPLGWLTEDGPAPWLADFGLIECEEPGYPIRTRRNVENSDGTLWLGRVDSPGAKATIGHARRIGKPWLIAVPGETRPSEVAAWIRSLRIATLNVAGNRESVAPGIGERAETFVGNILRRILKSHAETIR